MSAFVPVSALLALGWRDGLVVGRRTCDPEVAGSSPGRDAAAQVSCSHPTASVTKQYNLVPAEVNMHTTRCTSPVSVVLQIYLVSR